jgi:hypothetical protein
VLTLQPRECYNPEDNVQVDFGIWAFDWLLVGDETRSWRKEMISQAPRGKSFWHVDLLTGLLSKTRPIGSLIMWTS